MATLGPHCLREADVERAAGGGALPAAAADHLSVCEACRRRVEGERERELFLGRVRELGGWRSEPEGCPRLLGYRVLGVVSSGSQGVVYRALQESTSREVAIKLLAAGVGASERQRARAEREAEIVARLRHPNIVTVFECRVVPDGRIGVVMEYVDGVPIDKWEPPHGSAAERRRGLLRVFVDVCNAVHHAHLNGVIHRDLKPENILVTGLGRPVVLDFGIAKAGGIRTTLTGEFAGTPAYASPEQAAGRPDEVDGLTDVYSLGVVLYRLLCGSMPYELDGSLLEVVRAIRESPPVPVRQRDSSVPVDLEAIVMRAVRKNKRARYQSAAGLARDIERYLSGAPVEARSGSGWYVLGKAILMNRRRLALAGAGAAVALGAGVVVALSLESAAEAARRADRERDQARAEAVRSRALAELLREALPQADPGRPELAQIVGAGLGRLYFRLETGGFADEPELDQTLRRLWGSVYTGLGSGKAAALVPYAEVSLRNGIEQLRREHGFEHGDIAAAMHELGGVLLVRMRAPEAERHCRAALAMRQRLFGDGSEVAESRSLLARILLVQGRYTEAEREAEQASRYYAAMGPRGDLSLGAMAFVRARARLAADDPGGAEPLALESLVRRLRRLAPEDVDLNASLALAADVCERAPACELACVLAGVWDGSLASGPAATLRKDLPVLGAPDHGAPARSTPGDRTGALGRLLRLQERLLGTDDPALVRTLTSQMRAAEVERLPMVRVAAAVRAADILAAKYGPTDSSALVCIEEAALVLAYVGHPERSVELARRVREIRSSVPAGVRDAILEADSLRHLAWYLTLAGRYTEAAPEWRSALAVLREEADADHHAVAVVESGLAFCLAHMDRMAEADGMSLRALEHAERSPATAADQLLHVRFARGHVLALQGRWEEARPVLERAWGSFYAEAPAGFGWRRALLDDLASACERIGDSTAAAAWRACAGAR